MARYFQKYRKNKEIIEKEEVLKELLKEEARLAFEKRRFLPVKELSGQNNKAYAGSV